MRGSTPTPGLPAGLPPPEADSGENRLVFMGTSAVADGILQALCANPRFAPVGVVTPPDRPRGRGRSCSPCEVGRRAMAGGIPLCRAANVNDPAVRATIASWRPNIMVVASFGQFLGQDLLNLPLAGCLNVHLSLLPALRGAAPVQWAILKGDCRTGVTIMRMDSGMDSGDILRQRSLRIGNGETAGELEQRLTGAGAGLLLETLPDWLADRITPRPQDDGKATLAPKLDKRDAWLDWRLPAESLHRRIRAMNPRPGCYTVVPAAGREQAQRLLVLAATTTDYTDCPGASQAGPGEVLEAGPGRLLVATGCRLLEILILRPAGKRTMPAADYLRGHRIIPGTVLGAETATNGV